MRDLYGGVCFGLLYTQVGCVVLVILILDYTRVILRYWYIQLMQGLLLVYINRCRSVLTLKNHSLLTS